MSLQTANSGHSAVRGYAGARDLLGSLSGKPELKRQEETLELQSADPRETRDGDRLYERFGFQDPPAPDGRGLGGA
jgi:hypothetical protein